MARKTHDVRAYSGDVADVLADVLGDVLGTDCLLGRNAAYLARAALLAEVRRLRQEAMNDAADRLAALARCC